MDVPIISITGTKGKTTTTYVVSQVLQALNHNVLRVDTTGHYINGQQRSTLEDSKHIWSLVPTVAPGRYLWEFLAQPDLQKNGVAVLESSVGSSSLSGMAYRSHKVGLFLNVFEDHLGSSDRLQTRQDIAVAKQFIFQKLGRDGWAVFNADDPLVVDRLEVVPNHLGVKLLPCGLDFSYFELDSHLKNGGYALTVKDDKIVLLSNKKDKVLVDLKAVPWTFDAKYFPSVWNLLMATAAVFAFKQAEWSDEVTSAFEAVRLDRYGGRLTLLKAANGATILADYAHEKVSLQEIAKLARRLVKDDGKLIGILRLATDRTDKLIAETGQTVAKLYDQIIVFDKIDGHWRQPRPIKSVRFAESVGRISKVLAGAIEDAGGNVERIIREDEAVKRAVQLAGPNDVIVYIVNDDVKRSINFAKKYFKADFV
jgi:cyanophycin synthetase